MSLLSALNTAAGSLSAIQTRLSVASTNIANADDATYTAKTVKTSTQVTSGTVSGVLVTEISSSVDQNLVKSLVKATSADAKASTTEDYLETLSDALGSLSSDDDSGTTVASYLADLESALDTLATTPDSATDKAQVVADLDDTLSSLRTLSSTVQDQRASADQAIADGVATINDALNTIASLNDQIAAAQAAGESTSDLEDQRRAALETVAGQIDVSYYVSDDGRMSVYTGSGQQLVGSTVHEISYTAATSVSADTTFSAITVDGIDITDSISSGAIAALVTLRDDTLPAVQDQLDDLAETLKTTLNAISNEGSADPPPNSLTGTQSATSTDSFSGSGTLTVALTDSDGDVVSTQTLDLSSYSSVGDLVTALDGLTGISASLDADGHLTISADDSSQGIVVSGGTVGSGNLSAYFGLNDMVTGSGASSMTVKSELLADSSLLSTASIADTLTTGDAAVSSGSGTLAQSMADALDTADLTGTAGTIVGKVATALSSAETLATSTSTTLSSLTSSFSSQYGVNTDEETALISQLEDAYSASAQILSTVKSMFESLLEAVQ